MEWRLSALPFDLHPLIAEAKRRARRRRFLIAAVVLVVAGVAAGGVLTSGAGGSAGQVPWLPIRPNLGPASPPPAPPCRASQLKATLSLQGATQNLVGGISFVNGSSRPCALTGKPRLSFAGATSKWRETRWEGSTDLAFDPLAPPLGSLRALAPGKHVMVGVSWGNWCGRGSSDLGSPGRPPAAIVVAAPGGGSLVLGRNGLGEGAPRSLGAPNCLQPRSPSTLEATRYTPFVPQGPPTSELPLKARIVSAARLTVKGKAVSPALVARPGGWLSYTVLLTNRSRKPFSFGRSCPAYTEQIDAYRGQAFVLNCRGVESISPGTSVRFAMRIRVPRRLGASHLAALGWILAPHTWNAPQAVPATLTVRR
jgi:hypothetical protein